MKRSAWILAAALAATPAGAIARAGERSTDDEPGYEVVPLSGLTPGRFNAVALNRSGEVAGIVFATPTAPQRAFVWSPDDLRTLELPTPFEVRGLNDDGIVVGSVPAPGSCAIFLWDSRSGAVTTIPTPASEFPSDINDDLLVVGGDCNGLQGFALDAVTESFESIAFGAPPASSAGTVGAQAVNASATAVGSEVVFLPAKGYHEEVPYRWTRLRGIRALPTLTAGFGGRAAAINSEGDIAGYVIDDVSGKQTALWTREGALTNLGSPDGYFVSEATAINGRRQITVVAPNDLNGYTRAFLWDDGEFIDLSEFTASTGLFALRPLDIDDRGTVLVQLGDAEGLVILDVVLLRPTRGNVAARKTKRVFGPLPFVKR